VYKGIAEAMGCVQRYCGGHGPRKKSRKPASHLYTFRYFPISPFSDSGDFFLNGCEPFAAAYALLFLALFTGCVWAIAASPENVINVTDGGAGSTTIVVGKGERVTWVNNSSEDFRARGIAPEGVNVWVFDSGEIPPGEGFSYVFGEEGNYAYLCMGKVTEECGIIVG